MLAIIGRCGPTAFNVLSPQHHNTRSGTCTVPLFWNYASRSTCSPSCGSREIFLTLCKARSPWKQTTCFKFLSCIDPHVICIGQHVIHRHVTCTDQHVIHRQQKRRNRIFQFIAGVEIELYIKITITPRGNSHVVGLRQKEWLFYYTETPNDTAIITGQLLGNYQLCCLCVIRSKTEHTCGKLHFLVATWHEVRLRSLQFDDP